MSSTCISNISISVASIQCSISTLVSARTPPELDVRLSFHIARASEEIYENCLLGPSRFARETTGETVHTGEISTGCVLLAGSEVQRAWDSRTRVHGDPG
jgi:hypothetical protein